MAEGEINVNYLYVAEDIEKHGRTVEFLLFFVQLARLNFCLLIISGSQGAVTSDRLSRVHRLNKLK